MRQIICIGKYTILEGIRDKILYVSVFIILGLLIFSSYLSLLTLTSPEIAFTSFSFYFLKIFSVFSLIFLMVFQLYREKKKRAYEIILTRLYNKAHYIWGKFIGYNILYLLVTFTVVIFIFLITYILWNGLYFKLFLYPIILSLQFFIISSVIFLLYLVFTSPTITTITSLAIFFASHFSLDFYMFSAKTAKGLLKYLYLSLYYIFPNTEPFLIEKTIIHNLPISPSYISLLFKYGLAYGLLVIFISGLIFNNKRDY